MSDEIQLCQGLEDCKPCNDCQRRNMRVEFQKSYYYPPIDTKTGECSFYWASTDWQDPKRDDVIAKNGNNGEHYE